MNDYKNYDYLAHFGMKWGVRRLFNKKYCFED